MRTSSRLKATLTDPLSLVELFVVANVAFLTVDIVLAHSVNAFAHWAEWIPFVVSLAAPPLLLVSMWLAGSLRPPLPTDDDPLTARQRLSRALGLAVGVAAIVVGVAMNRDRKSVV